MSMWSDLKKKAVQANPELAEKASQALKRVTDLTLEASQKAEGCRGQDSSVR